MARASLTSRANGADMSPSCPPDFLYVIPGCVARASVGGSTAAIVLMLG